MKIRALIIGMLLATLLPFTGAVGRVAIERGWTGAGAGASLETLEQTDEGVMKRKRGWNRSRDARGDKGHKGSKGSPKHSRGSRGSRGSKGSRGSVSPS